MLIEYHLPDIPAPRLQKSGYYDFAVRNHHSCYLISGLVVISNVFNNIYAYRFAKTIIDKRQMYCIGNYKSDILLTSQLYYTACFTHCAGIFIQGD